MSQFWCKSVEATLQSLDKIKYNNFRGVLWRPQSNVMTMQNWCSVTYAVPARKAYEAMAKTIDIKIKVEIKLEKHHKPLLKCIYLHHSPTVSLSGKTLSWDDCFLQWLNTTPCTVHKIQVLALICCKRKTQQQRYCLQKSLSHEWQCVPLSLPACPSWMGSLTLMDYSAVGHPPAALADIHPHSALPWHLKHHCYTICGMHNKFLIWDTAQIWEGLWGEWEWTMLLAWWEHVEEGRECRQRNAAEHTGNKSSSFPRGHTSCFISPGYFWAMGTSILKLFLPAPICLCLGIHAIVPSDVKYSAWNTPGKGEDQ